LIVSTLISCNGQIEIESNISDDVTIKDSTIRIDAVTKYYNNHRQDSVVGQSIGTVSNGSLKNGTLIPFSGENYVYFDTTSYLTGRAFTHQLVAKSVVESYEMMFSLGETRIFRVMEFSNQHGGKIFPHRTHQNGRSVDLMMPLIQNNKPYYHLDSLGISHYFLEFDKQGKYVEDPTVSIDFNLTAQHLLVLDEVARKNGLRINKVIFNTDLKDDLYATENGMKLKAGTIYITRNLSPLINALHDDHYHVDFEPLK